MLYIVSIGKVKIAKKNKTRKEKRKKTTVGIPLAGHSAQIFVWRQIQFVAE